ncbi:zinc-type alcohol dehydrogenase-like protein c16a3.02c [Anaeramoeba flamelloides]|uniref:Zinc-type alcohol dehydrogenase-like protein c16a3.02c n=1 Tax=Anaeramoeba flamelloides TaxID=1746091 RepID=A0AAV7Y8X5_9EUKA|nr:zinc-type alcohol dehydrogenase-like protein c16a3.02c [Anaeramoeba flamelloides]KAJ6228237.1 zinc-type alcohol dehydrogenase-like protein c16a3.02c [Anaeramoeba flamelloides]
MQAYYVTEKGGEIKKGEQPIPEPAKDEIRIKIKAIGLNPFDHKIVNVGPPKWKYPHILGLDVAGVVDAVGSLVTKFAIGDEVCGLCDFTRNGSFAEYVVVKTHCFQKKPSEIDWGYAISLVTGGMTAYRNVVEDMQIEEGKTILVQGGAGGVGSYAIQFAKNCGLKVFTTCSPNSNEFVKKLGADVCIDYHDVDVAKKCLELTEGKGVDYVFECVSLNLVPNDLLCVGKEGVVMTIVGIPEGTESPSENIKLTRSSLIKGHMFDIEEECINVGKSMQSVIDLAIEKKIQTTVTKTMPFDELLEGIELIKTGHSKGKVVITHN